MRFHNRSDAGQHLAARLTAYANRDDVLVLAIPRGGVVVGYEVARALRVPLDVFIVRKIGAEHIPELAVGAIASGGIQLIDHDAVRALRMTPACLDAVLVRERAELNRRETAYRGSRLAARIRGKTILLVDDGIATGASIRAAIAALRQRAPASIVIAVPVVDASVAAQLAPEADALISVLTPPHLGSVGEWYEHFDQTTDEEVCRLLEKN